MKLFTELTELGYKHYTDTTIEELDETTFISEDIIVETTMILKWFRDKHNYAVTIVRESNNNWKAILWEKDYLETIKEKYKSYEEAQIAAIKRLIEIVKQTNSRVA